MEHPDRAEKQKKVPHKKKHKSKHKKQMLTLLFILLVIAFALGFLFGLLVATKKEQKIDIVMSPAAVIENAEVSEAPEGPKEVIPEKDLPWNLTLVNFENELAEDFEPKELAEADNGYVVDARIADAAKKMIADARAKDNVRIIALSGYREYEYQKELFDNKVERLQLEKGYSVTKAREEAATVVAVPGTSEHQLGLALDLVDARHVKLDESQENTAAYKWMYKHCHEYGFIVRYPNGKTDITGIIYEPWHFRYVGVEAATFIMEKGITLEEYLTDYYTE
ncbi:MAG: M15 family metallopeptidase [Lachnospiraceae bacterium]|nr:M15 family metallopeptidase [Lachnospiraceae bacterium]